MLLQSSDFSIAYCLQGVCTTPIRIN